MKHLSLIIPAYNEEAIVESSLNEIISFLRNYKNNWEVIVVDDGSLDKTSIISKKFSDKGVTVIKLTKNQGKGGALRAGVLRSSGKFVAFMDADLSVPLDRLTELMKRLELGKDIVVASRRVKGSKIVEHQPLFRELFGRVFTFLTQIVTGVRINDFTCGFKGFSSEAAKKIFKNSLIKRWAYDAEIIFLAKKYGYKIDQMPVSWINRSESRVRLIHAMTTSFSDLLMIRINDFRGLYEKT